MAYLDIESTAIKYAGGGAKLQWAMAIGIGVDQFVHAFARSAKDDELLDLIREQLGARGKHVFPEPEGLDGRQAEVINRMLHNVGTSLSVKDLQGVFSERD
jgi:hypothetical protein